MAVAGWNEKQTQKPQRNFPTAERHLCKLAFVSGERPRLKGQSSGSLQPGHSRRAPWLMMADMLLMSLLQVPLMGEWLTAFAASWQR